MAPLIDALTEFYKRGAKGRNPIKPNGLASQGRWAEVFDLRSVPSFNRVFFTYQVVEVQLTPLPTPRSSPVPSHGPDNGTMTPRAVGIENDIEHQDSAVNGESSAHAGHIEPSKTKETSEVNENTVNIEKGETNERQGTNETSGTDKDIKTAPIEAARKPSGQLNGFIAQPKKGTKGQTKIGRKDGRRNNPINRWNTTSRFHEKSRTWPVQTQWPSWTCSSGLSHSIAVVSSYLIRTSTLEAHLYLIYFVADSVTRIRAPRGQSTRSHMAPPYTEVYEGYGHHATHA